MNSSMIIMFALATAGLALFPGPNVMLIVTRSASEGRRAGMLVVAGVECAFLFHLAATAAGLTVLLLAVPSAYEVLRAAGAAYLLLLAWQVVAGRHELKTDVEPQQSSAGALFRMGLLSNVLNPKTAAFYLAAFPQFLPPGQVGTPARIMLLGAVHIGVSTFCNVFYVVGAGRLPALFAEHAGWRRAQRWTVGTALAGFAVKLLLTRRPVAP